MINTPETPHFTPREGVGLTLEQQQESANLKIEILQHMLCVAMRADEREQYPNRSHVTATGIWTRLVEQVYAQHRVNKGVRAARKHYKQNEKAYQEQAIMDASEHVELKGWDS